MEGDYEEEWEAEEPSVDKKSVISTIGGQVYPLESDENDLTRDAEPTKPEASASDVHESATSRTDQLNTTASTSEDDFSEEELEAKVGKVAAVESCNRSEELPTSNHTLSGVGDDKANTTYHQPDSDTEVSPSNISNVTEAHHLLELVQIHDQHYPPPMTVKVSTLSTGTQEQKLPSQVDVGELQARIAAKRIVDFRRRQDLKAEEERELESMCAQKRREIRRSNDTMYKALGVAGLSSQDHLRLAQRRRKQKERATEVLASRDRQNRWYNNIPKRAASSLDHIRELNMQFSRAKREQQQKMHQNQKHIQANQLELRQKARAIANKANGAYVRGSYLLQVTHQTIKAQTNPSEDSDYSPEDEAVAPHRSESSPIPDPRPSSTTLLDDPDERLKFPPANGGSGQEEESQGDEDEKSSAECSANEAAENDEEESIHATDAADDEGEDCVHTTEAAEGDGEDTEAGSTPEIEDKAAETE